MKKISLLLVAIFIYIISLGSTFALSFAPGTVFLDAKTQSECDRLGGNFTEWYGEIYCTKTGYYKSFEELINAEPSCKRATDGCNSVMIMNGQLGAMTQMYCEHIYGSEGGEMWECLDQKLEDETLAFMSENDRNYYKLLASQVGVQTQERVARVLDTLGNSILERYSWDVAKSVKYTERLVRAFENAIYELSMKTPADKAMSETDTMKYQILNYAKFELQIMMHRWMRNAGMK